MDWKLVYDFGNESLRIGWMFISPTMVIIGYGMCAHALFREKSDRWKRVPAALFGFVYGTLALFFSVTTIPANIAKFYESKAVYEGKQYRVLEGAIENFRPMPRTGHALESFTVNGVKFEYSDYDQSYYGFNNTRSHGGPLYGDAFVRLWYYTSNSRNIILRIELAGNR